LFTVEFRHRIDIALGIIEECARGTRARILFVYILYKSIFGLEKKRDREREKREKRKKEKKIIFPRGRCARCDVFIVELTAASV